MASSSRSGSSSEPLAKDETLSDRDEQPTPELGAHEREALARSSVPAPARHAALTLSLLPVFGELEAAVGNARRRWTERRALLLRLEDEEGRVGLGEAAPLPGYSRDSLDRARASLRVLDVARIAREVDLDHGTLEELLVVVERHVGGGSAAATFALESALLDLSARRRGRSVAALLGEWLQTTPVAIEAAQVVTDREAAERALTQGHRTLKLKLGRDLDQELTLAEGLRRDHAELALRFDANRALPRPRVDEVFRRLAELDAELLEEPVPMEALAGLPRGLCVALDESLQARDAPIHLARLLDRGDVGAVVLKPTAIGLRRSLALARLARSRDAKVIVSHCLEGPVALAGCVALAQSLGGELAHGLGAHVGLTAWAPVGLAPERGRWSLPTAAGLLPPDAMAALEAG